MHHLLRCALAVLVGVAGCTSRPPTAPVSGRVTLDGKPLEFGHVFFQSGKGVGSGGRIGPGGRFVVGERGGATVGLNAVAVSCTEADSPGFRQPESGEPVAGKSLVPERYASTASSGITVDVAPGMADVEIDLRSE